MQRSSNQLKKIYLFLLLLITVTNVNAQTNNIRFYKADNPLIQYTGRIVFSGSALPKCWAPGVYEKATFKGAYCEIIINDEMLYGNSHNYISVIVDNNPPVRIKLTGKINNIQAPAKLADTKHTITVCKSTECGIGYIEFGGIKCKALLASTPRPLRKIECIGNSITCGMASDLTIPCGTGDWYDQHNAWLSYGAITARALNAQFHLTAESGIGLIHSCCDKPIVMPQVFDKVDLRDDSVQWDFKKYQPGVVTICLGQNDGIQDSTAFCGAYIRFIHKLRSYYPHAMFICLTSPMADETLLPVLKKYLTAIVKRTVAGGDKEVYKYFFSKRYFHGCGVHPDLEEHRQIASELIRFIKQVKHW